jgi:hypothetical protein
MLTVMRRPGGYMLRKPEIISMPALQKAGRLRPLSFAHRRSRNDAGTRYRMSLKRLPGRLNLFQATMLDWRDMHPYNAVHAVRLDRPLDRDAVTRAIDETLSSAGLTGLTLDRARRRYAWRGGRSHATVEIIPAGDNWQATIARAFGRQLNEPFERDGPIDPFRFFVVDLGGAFYLGLGYDHFIAGGDSIVVLLNAIADRCAGLDASIGPLSLYPRTHARLFLRHPVRFVRGIGRLRAMAASCRRTIRPRYRTLDDLHNAFTFFTLDPPEFTALRNAAKSFGVTLNDALIALLLLAQDAQMPGRDRSKRRSEFAVASIMNLRDAHGEDVRRTFGQFLSSFRISHAVPPGITLRELAQDVHRATAQVKREKLFLTTLSAIAIDRVIGRFQTREQRLGVYAKSYPVGAGVSSLNVNPQWRTAGGGAPPPYIRGVPTGPASPLVVAVTTSADTLCAGISYRTAALTGEAVARIRDDIIIRIKALS